MKHPDFLIIGAGIIGLSTAWELSNAGFSITIIDRAQAGRESSWAGGGILFPLWPWNYPKTVTALTEYGRTLYPNWTTEISAISGIDPEYRQSGMLALPPLDLEIARHWCENHNLRAETVNAKKICSSLSKDDLGLWLPEIAQVRNPRLLQALIYAARVRGIEIKENTEVSGFSIQQHQVSHVITNNGPLSASAIIVCAGAWSTHLLGNHAAGAHVFPVKGQMLLYKTAPETLNTILHKEDNYLIPRADGHILVGSTKETTGFDNATSQSAALALHQFAARLLPCLSNLNPIGHWAGLRPGSPGNIPIIGRHPNIENLYLNSGHFRYGLTMAPAAATILKNSIVGHQQTLDISPYNWRET